MQTAEEFSKVSTLMDFLVKDCVECWISANWNRSQLRGYFRRCVLVKSEEGR